MAVLKKDAFQQNILNMRPKLDCGICAGEIVHKGFVLYALPRSCRPRLVLLFITQSPHLFHTAYHQTLGHRRV